MSNKRIYYLLVAFLVVCLLLIGVYYESPYLPVCILYVETGVHCPGCGLTRASRAMLDFDFVSALHYNPLFTIISPVLVFWFTMELVYWVQKRDYDFFRPSPKIIWIIFTVVVVWFITRNIPHKAFEWARPTPDTIFDQE